MNQIDIKALREELAQALSRKLDDIRGVVL